MEIKGFVSSNTKIWRATKNEMPEIMLLARSFDLDCQDLYYTQFLFAEKNGRVIGFGRLIHYDSFTELATLGVIPQERNKGTGSALVKELVKGGKDIIYVVCVIPGFFARLGFQSVKEYPDLLKRKVDFCKCYGFRQDEIFVMQFISQ